MVSVTYVKYSDCSVGSHQVGAAPAAPPLPTSKSVIHGAGLPPQPACQKIGMSWMPAALALASSVSNSVKLNVPAAGSIVPHGMLSSAVVRPSAASPAKNDSDQAAPLLSKSSWVDHIGVVGDEAAWAGAPPTAPRPSKPATRAPVMPSAADMVGVRRLRRARKNPGARSEPGAWKRRRLGGAHPLTVVSHFLLNTYIHLLTFRRCPWTRARIRTRRR